MRVDRRILLGGLAALVAAPAWPRGPASFPPPTREAMLPAPGGRVYVRVNGDLSGPRPPIVMIHGGPGGTHAAFLDALALADERAVILYDQLDSGKSDHPGDPSNWTVGRFTDEVEAIRTGLGVARWHVLGHSWGGTVALEYAARRPQALRGVALASPLVSTRSWLADAAVLLATLPAPVQAEIARCAALGSVRPPPACDAATADFYARYNAREPASDGELAYARESSGRGFNPVIYRTMWGDSEFVSTGTLKAYDGEPLLAKLDGPRTLFLGGQYDEARPSTLAGFAARVAGSEFATIPGAGHAVFGDRPLESVALVRGWLARQDAIA